MCFSVDKRSNKVENKRFAIEKDIRMLRWIRLERLITTGKTGETHSVAYSIGRRSSIKKAYVKLREGTIEYFTKGV